MCHVWSIFPRLNLNFFEVGNPENPSILGYLPVEKHWFMIRYDLQFVWMPDDRALIHELSRIQAAEPIAYHCVRIQEIHRTNSSLHWLQFNVQLKASNLNVSIFLLLYVLHSCVPKVLSMLLRHGMNQCSLDPLGLFDACKNAMLFVVHKQTGCQNCRLTRLPG